MLSKGRQDRDAGAQGRNSLCVSCSHYDSLGVQVQCQRLHTNPCQPPGTPWRSRVHFYCNLFCGHLRVDANHWNHRHRWHSRVETTRPFRVSVGITLLCLELREFRALEELRRDSRCQFKRSLDNSCRAPGSPVAHRTGLSLTCLLTFTCADRCKTRRNRLPIMAATYQTCVMNRRITVRFELMTCAALCRVRRGSTFRPGARHTLQISGRP
jgi:hypothetical protein